MAGLFCFWHFLGDYLDSILGVLGFDLGVPTRRQRQGLSQHL